MGSERWMGIAEALPEALRLAEGARRLLQLPGTVPSPGPGDDLVPGIREGRLTGRLWIGPKDEAVGLAVWERGVPMGRRAFVHLDTGFRRASVLGAFVDRLRAEPGERPLLSVVDPVPGLPAAEVEIALTPRGFQRILRVDLLDPGGPLPDAPELPGVRSVGAADAVPLARLLAEAYDDNPLDRALFWHELDALDDARFGIDQLFSGGVGTFWPDASFGVPSLTEPGRLLAATLVNDLNGPLLTEVMVAPDARRHGYARALVRASVAAVRARSAVPLRLVVSLRNRRAYALYERLGFRRDEATLGGAWLDPQAFGLRSLDPPWDGAKAPTYQT
jgi:GNAT superfamily N-acetyltransferase